MGTKFSVVYNRFLGKITDDMYIELTPQDTVRDLQRLLIDAIPDFEFPRVNLLEYELATEEVYAEDIDSSDFVIGTIWNNLDCLCDGDETVNKLLIEKSSFEAELTAEEIDILATIMLINWVQRQVTSIENTRMKYSGTDFKMTSQANHLQKLLALLSECQRQSHHMQRLYKRRRFRSDGRYRSNWDIFNTYD